MVTGVYAWCKYVMPRPSDWQPQLTGETEGRKGPATEVRVAKGRDGTEKGTQGERSPSEVRCRLRAAHCI